MINIVFIYSYVLFFYSNDNIEIFTLVNEWKILTVLYLILLLKSNNMFVDVAVLQNIVAKLLFFAESSLFSFSQFCLLLQWEFIFLPNFSSLKKIKGKEMARYFFLTCCFHFCTRAEHWLVTNVLFFTS